MSVEVPVHTPDIERTEAVNVGLFPFEQKPRKIKETGKALQYNVIFDSEKFSALVAQRNSSDFVENLETQKAYIKTQLKTDIGERLEKSESKIRYKIKDGKLFGQGSEEPFEDVIQRGILDRYHSGKVQDRPREKAELEGFKIMQGIMTDPNTPEGTTILYVSPSGTEGTNYEMSFFDVSEKRDGEVDTTRYLSNLTNDEYRLKILSLNPSHSAFIPNEPSDVDFLKSPVVIPSHLDFSDQDALAKYMLKEKIGISDEEFEGIWLQVAPYYTSYINTLVENPEDIYFLELSYRSFLNATKNAADQKPVYIKKPTRQDIINLGKLPVTIGGGSCGIGCSVSEFGLRDEYGPLNFDCPACGKRNDRVAGHLIENCQECGSDEVLPAAFRKKPN